MRRATRLTTCSFVPAVADMRYARAEFYDAVPYRKRVLKVLSLALPFKPRVLMPGKLTVPDGRETERRTHMLLASVAWPLCLVRTSAPPLCISCLRAIGTMQVGMKRLVTLQAHSVSTGSTPTAPARCFRAAAAATAASAQTWAVAVSIPVRRAATEPALALVLTMSPVGNTKPASHGHKSVRAAHKPAQRRRGPGYARTLALVRPVDVPGMYPCCCRYIASWANGNVITVALGAIPRRQGIQQLDIAVVVGGQAREWVPAPRDKSEIEQRQGFVPFAVCDGCAHAAFCPAGGRTRVGRGGWAPRGSCASTGQISSRGGG
jgi:hypothetical protein